MHIGSPEEWLDLIDSQVPDIIALVIDTWEEMPPPAANELEDRVTEELCRALRHSPRARELPFQIHIQSVELNPAEGQDQGRMDIGFYLLVPSEDIYFCLECKRLNVRGTQRVRAYYAEYVRFGMMRFVRGQYSHSVRNGGMLAFVLNGDVDSAITGVEGNIRALHSELGMDSPGLLATSSIRPDDMRVRETVHRRLGTQDQLLIHHLFMAGDPNAPLSPDSPKPSGSKSSKSRMRKRKDAA